MSTQKFVALVGQPNAGKTTLFNQLTGLNSKVVNYPGSTVDIAKGPIKENPDITIIDLPGITSLDPQSEDEKITHQALYQLNELIKEARKEPDLVIFVLDQTQRSRHLSVLKQCLDANLNLVVALSMTDLAQKEQKALDPKKLSTLIGCPVHTINHQNKNEKTIINKLINQDYFSKKESHKTHKISQQEIGRNYEWAEQIIKKTQLKNRIENKAWDLDALFLHPILGPMSFVVLMGLFFTSIFTLAAPLMDGVDAFFSMLSLQVSSLAPSNLITKVISEGLITGLGGIFVFVPQIAILFFGLGILESTGYLARAAVIIDKPLSKIGLSGRCFLPMLAGCACAIPAMMAARNIPNKWEKRICLWIIPLMQCSARLPVYGLLLGLLFFNKPWFSGIGLTIIYLASVLFACLIAALLSRGNQKGTYFQMELPHWRWPNIKIILIQTIQKTKSFITNAGPIIIIISIVLWTISVFPTEQNSIAMWLGQWLTPIWEPMGLDWRVGVAILLSFAAREVFVSVLAVLFTIQAGQTSLLTTLQQATWPGTQAILFTPSVIVGLIIFYMIALQCGATVGIAKKEMGNWKEPLLQLVSYSVLAYVLAVMVQWVA